MLKKLLLVFATTTFASSAFANCYGSSKFYNCNDLAHGSLSQISQLGHVGAAHGFGGQSDGVFSGDPSFSRSTITGHEIAPINSMRSLPTLKFGPHGYDASGKFFSGGSLWD